MYNKTELFDQALKAIEKNKLMFIEEVVSFLPCAKSTFYVHFPTESDEYKKMQERIERNRVMTKATLRGKWYRNGNPTTEIILYKLLATPEEQRAISMNTHNVEGRLDGSIEITRRVIGKPEKSE